MKRIVINNLLDGIFYAKLVCLKDGEVFEVDSRTSDAIAMAVRFECPIYTFGFIMDEAGVIIENTDEEQQALPTKKRSKKSKTSLDSMSIADLNSELQTVLDKEDYEKAARIRDEINKRKEKDG